MWNYTQVRHYEINVYQVITSLTSYYTVLILYFVFAFCILVILYSDLLLVHLSRVWFESNKLCIVHVCQCAYMAVNNFFLVLTQE